MFHLTNNLLFMYFWYLHMFTYLFFWLLYSMANAANTAILAVFPFPCPCKHAILPRLCHQEGSTQKRGEDHRLLIPPSL